MKLSTFSFVVLLAASTAVSVVGCTSMTGQSAG